MSLGNNVRVDDFAILSGEISIGDYVHISAGVKLYAVAGLRIGNFCGASPNSTIYTASDDFSGNAMISPLVPEELTDVHKSAVIMEDYVQLGADSIVMPGVKLAEGSCTGAFTFVTKDLLPWSINIGIPCRFYKSRAQTAKELSKKLEQTIFSGHNVITLPGG